MNFFILVENLICFIFGNFRLLSVGLNKMVLNCVNVVGVKEDFVILLLKRMFGMDNGANDSKKEVSDVPYTWKG